MLCVRISSVKFTTSRSHLDSITYLLVMTWSRSAGRLWADLTARRSDSHQRLPLGDELAAWGLLHHSESPDGVPDMLLAGGAPERVRQGRYGNSKWSLATTTRSLIINRVLMTVSGHQARRSSLLEIELRFILFAYLRACLT